MAVSVENQVLIETEVQKLYKKYPLSITSQCRTGVSKHLISCTEKGGGGERPVVNLKPLNQKIPYEHFKMEGIHMLQDLLKKRII